jgi:hypothetical protein
MDDEKPSRDAAEEQNENSLIEARSNLTRFSIFRFAWLPSRGVDVVN